MPRSVRIDMNVTVPDHDDRDAGEIAAAILGAVEVGQDDDSVRELVVEAVGVEDYDERPVAS